MTGMLSSSGGGRGLPCPICRKPLSRADVFETMSPEEEKEAAEQRARELLLAAPAGGMGEYGAKV
jgi:hypothetical protein